MSLEEQLEEHYRRNWAAKRWQKEVAGYDPDALARLARRYGRFKEARGWGRALSHGLKNYSKLVIKPWVGPRYQKSAYETVVLLREYPLPALIEGRKLLPQSRGEDPIGPSIMRDEIEELLGNFDKSPYKTLGSACRWAHAVERQVRGKGDCEVLPQWINRIVVTDLVKPFAIFRGMTLDGLHFDHESHERLSRKSVHNKHMYRWALAQLKAELDLLDPSLVVSFVGNAGWACADDSREGAHLDEILSSYKVVFCAHPGARSRAAGRHHAGAWCCTPSWRSKKNQETFRSGLACPQCGK